MTEENVIKSLRFDEISYVTFHNRTTRKVAILWHDYEGKCVRYAVILPGAVHDMNTFVTHPWSAIDSDTGDKLLIDKELIFYPRSQIDREDENLTSEKVHIDIPVYPLWIRCLQVIRSSVSPENIDSLPIPASLKHSLKHIPNIQYRNYDGFIIAVRQDR